MRLAGRVTMVTGGASAIGEATCRAYSAQGAAVVVVDEDEAAAAKIASDLDRALAISGHCHDRRFAAMAVERTLDEFGALDVLAAFATTQPTVSPPDSGVDAFLTMTDREWRGAHESHLDATFAFAQAALKAMSARGSGSVVTLSSVEALRGRAGFPHSSSAAAGVLGLTRSLAADFSPHGIRVNAIAVGLVSVDKEPSRTASVPIGREAAPCEIANVATFLASDESSFVFGETVSVNGGLLTI